MAPNLGVIGVNLAVRMFQTGTVLKVRKFPYKAFRPWYHGKLGDKGPWEAYRIMSYDGPSSRS